MVERVCCFLVVLLLMFNGAVFGQQNAGFKAIPLPVGLAGYDGRFSGPGGELSRMKMPVLNDTTGKRIVWNPISSSLYVNSLGFICKKELQIDKVLTLPVRFRLGSLDYVNYLEQKPNAVKPQR